MPAKPSGGTATAVSSAQIVTTTSYTTIYAPSGGTWVYVGHGSKKAEVEQTLKLPQLL